MLLQLGAFTVEWWENVFIKCPVVLADENGRMAADHKQSSYPTPCPAPFRSLGFIIFLHSEMYSMTANTIQCSYAVVNHAISQFIKLNIIILCKMQL